MHGFFQIRALLAEGLGVFGFVPDGGFAEFKLYFGEAFLFLVEVKDTPGARAGARNNP